jgi:TatA/E family protein of Tat protein translocase
MALGWTEVLIALAIIAILLLIPKKLPELARSIGLAKKEYKKAAEEPEKPAKRVQQRKKAKKTKRK